MMKIVVSNFVVTKVLCRYQTQFGYFLITFDLTCLSHLNGFKCIHTYIIYTVNIYICVYIYIYIYI